MPGAQARHGKSTKNLKSLALGFKLSNANPSNRPSPLTICLSMSVLLYLALHVSYLLEITTGALLTLNGLWYDLRNEGDLIRLNPEGSTSSEEMTYPTLASFSSPSSTIWDVRDVVETIPVVFYWSRTIRLRCVPYYYMTTVVEQALKLNSEVHLIGPSECSEFYTKKGVHYHNYEEFEDVFEWFLKNIGMPVDDHVRWFILKRFLENSDFNRVFYSENDVMLYANVTELAAWTFPLSHMVLPVRWPSFRPPLRVHQYPSMSVGLHVALFSYEALSDWCLFLLEAFRMELFGLPTISTELTTRPEYKDSNIAGLYTFGECWLEDLNPPCLSFSRDLALSMRGRFRPKFRVESFCQPRMCQNSTWSDEGLCVFDNNFSLTTSTLFFKFSHNQKCPTSMNYAYYQAWVGKVQNDPVQFLGVHFEGKMRKFLHIEDNDPELSWGGSNM